MKLLKPYGELRQISIDDINFTEPGKLYRGHGQERLEVCLLRSIAKKIPLSYSGTENRREGDITFLGPYKEDAVSFGIRYKETLQPMVDTAREEGPYFPFTFHPLIFSLDVTNYKDRLFTPTHGEGVVIRGPISLDDMEILHSSWTNRFFDDLEQTHSAREAEFQYGQLHSSGWDEKDILTRFREDPRQVMADIREYISIAHNLEVKDEHFEEFIATLERMREQ